MSHSLTNLPYRLPESHVADNLDKRHSWLNFLLNARMEGICFIHNILPGLKKLSCFARILSWSSTPVPYSSCCFNSLKHLFSRTVHSVVAATSFSFFSVAVTYYFHCSLTKVKFSYFSQSYIVSLRFAICGVGSWCTLLWGSDNPLSQRGWLLTLCYEMVYLTHQKRWKQQHWRLSIYRQQYYIPSTCKTSDGTKF